MNSNSYSVNWFDTFLESYMPVKTEAEVAFLTSHLPLPAYARLLDLCCGEGRHAAELAKCGYRVTGLDNSAYALDIARERAPEAFFIKGDMRQLASLAPGPFSAVISMWQSFGYFGKAANKSILEQIHRVLRPGGRFVLDIYHRDFFRAHQETRTFRTAEREVTERKQMSGNRLSVTLSYGETEPNDTFSWQLFTPAEIGALAARAGFSTVAACSNWNKDTPPDPQQPRMQFVFQKG